MEHVEIRRGAGPLIVTMPHTGSFIPPGLEDGFASRWLALRDCDWHIERLYDFAADLDATMIRATVSRSVIDLNRDPSGQPLYPGQASTGLCPLTTFDGDLLYRPGREPDAEMTAQRLESFFHPYHQAVAAEIGRLRSAHERVVLYDAHSIRSRIPRLFAGELPIFNIGANMRRSCAPELADKLAAVAADSGFSWVLDGRFRGGWITRHYGRPDDGVHAIQMELAMRGYMIEPDIITADTWPTAFDAACAEPVAGVLRRFLEACLNFATG